MQLFRQLTTFFGVGVVSIIADYSTLVLLCEVFDVSAVIGALAGHIVGGIVNYLLNRAHTFATDRNHMQALWRFASVMAVGFSLTGLFMWIFADKLEIPYLVARVITTGIVFCWNFAAHKLWTFGEKAP